MQTASMEDVSTHPLLYRCLELLQQVRDLASSNKALRALWVGKDRQLELVLKLFLQCRQGEHDVDRADFSQHYSASAYTRGGARPPPRCSR